MANTLERIVSVTLERAGEGELFFKTWAPHVSDAEDRALFAHLAATERGRVEMLSRMSPAELVGKGQAAPEADELAPWLKARTAPKTLVLRDALRLAVERKERSALLFDWVAGLRGEAASFFEAMAAEDRGAAFALRDCAERLGPNT